MVRRLGYTTPRDMIPVDLSAAEVRNLIGICIELVSLCARVTGKLDPAMGTMIRYARDQALGEALNINI